MGLDEIPLTITICKTCNTFLIATADKRNNYIEDEKRIINKISELTGKKIRWSRRAIPDWAHCHLE